MYEHLFFKEGPLDPIETEMLYLSQISPVLIVGTEKINFFFCYEQDIAIFRTFSFFPLFCYLNRTLLQFQFSLNFSITSPPRTST